MIVNYIVKHLSAILLGITFTTTVTGQMQKETKTKSAIDAFNVVWDTPGPMSSQSMPFGNGDIGLNVWVEQNGDLCFFISKTDAWGAAAENEPNGWIKDGGVLMKLGKVRLSLSPSPFSTGTKFSQVLKLSESEIVVQEGEENTGASFRIWVDANNPVIRLESKSNKPMSLKVSLENWRLGKSDTIIETKRNEISWYHKNPSGSNPHLSTFIFGGTIEGRGLTKSNDTTLQALQPATSQLISIYPLTTQHLTLNEWQTRLADQVTNIRSLKLEQTRAAHQQWWKNFWQRSWIYIHDTTARMINQGYVLQRYVTACAGRGAYPIKFNGSIFVVDNPKYKNGETTTAIDADFREWGGQYWMQNTRPMYWPRLKAGDFDMMLPLFKMYAEVMTENSALIKKYYNHDGVYFAETMPFWGGLKYVGPEVKENWTDHYFLPILELSMMMLDYYDYTGDEQFAKDFLIPIASAGITFYDRHFKRDESGKLLLDPVNAIEQFWKVHNPAPDIAGLHAVVKRLIDLPSGITDSKLHEQWQRLYGELPALPVGEKDTRQVLLPYTGPQTAQPRNFENPELYAVYPFRLYGLGKPNLDVATNTFNTRIFKDKGCWAQDPIQAAMLGLTDVAKAYVEFNFTRKDPSLKFPAFWSRGHDYMPDQDNGGNGEHGLQEMLMQTDGKKIMLLPAWPKEWDADFKLNAPYKTTVEGSVKNGKLIKLVVTPSSRKADVVDLSNQN